MAFFPLLFYCLSCIFSLKIMFRFIKWMRISRSSRLKYVTVALMTCCSIIVAFLWSCECFAPSEPKLFHFQNLLYVIGHLLWNRANCNHGPNICRDLPMTPQGSHYDLHIRPFNEVRHEASPALIISCYLLRPSFLTFSLSVDATCCVNSIIIIVIVSVVLWPQMNSCQSLSVALCNWVTAVECQ